MAAQLRNSVATSVILILVRMTSSCMVPEPTIDPDEFCPCAIAIVGKCPDTYQWSSWGSLNNEPNFEYEGYADLQRTRGICPFFQQPAAIEVRTVQRNFEYSRGQNLQTVRKNFVSCRGRDQSAGCPCPDYRVRFCCRSRNVPAAVLEFLQPPPLIACRCAVSIVRKCPTVGFTWTRWFDEDDPDDQFEIESFTNIKRKYRICPLDEEPEAVDIRTVIGNHAYGQTQNVLSISRRLLLCVNNDNPGCPCHDYKVRYCCRPPVSRPVFPPFVPVSPPFVPVNPPGVVGGRCGRGFRWTEWVNQDGPDGEGDIERRRNCVCRGPTPRAIQVRRVGDQAPYEVTGDLVHVDVDSGSSCVNIEQCPQDPNPNVNECDDYETRYCCPIIVPFGQRRSCRPDW